MADTTRNFENIISFTANAENANAAILGIMGQLKNLQAIARETGISLTAALSTPSTSYYSQLMQVSDIGKQVRDITMGSMAMPVGGRMPSSGGIDIWAGDREAGQIRALMENIDSEQQKQNVWEAFVRQRTREGSLPRSQGYAYTSPGATYGTGAQSGGGSYSPPPYTPPTYTPTGPLPQQGQWTGAQLTTQLNTPTMTAQQAQYYQQLTAAAAQYYNLTGQSLPILQQQNTQLQGTSSALDGLGKRIGSIALGMFVWQGMNLVMNTVGQVIGTVVDETSRLDSASARLSVTLNTSKENARQYAQALSMMGVAYGQTPETSQGLGFYISRVNKSSAGQQDLFKAAAGLAQYTGEDPIKLADNLNVAAKQTGLSYEHMANMAAAAFEKTGTPATDALNMIREIGPLAKSTGVDIEWLFGVIVKMADQAGGSISDATNSWTRLTTAIRTPNEAQKNILLSRGINYGTDVDINAEIEKLRKLKLTTEELSQLGGRPGMPAVANDMRTLFMVLDSYDGKLTETTALSDKLVKSTDSMDAAWKRLDSSTKSFSSSVAQIPVLAEAATIAINSYAVGFTGLASAVSRLDLKTFSAILVAMQTGNVTGILAIAGGEMARAVPNPSSMPTEVQRALAAGGATSAYSGTNITAAAEKPAANILPFPTSATDVSQYTKAQYQSALAMTGKLFDNWMASYKAMLQNMEMDPNSIANAMKDEINRIAKTTLMAQSGAGYQYLQGPSAYFLQSALSQITSQQASTSRLESLQDRLAELRRALEELDDTEKKRAQLEGQWNIPTGARLLVPLTAESQALMKEHGGETEDQAKERRRQQILREIADVEAKIAKEKETIASQQALGKAFTTTGTSLDTLGSAAHRAANHLDEMAKRGSGAKVDEPNKKGATEMNYTPMNYTPIPQDIKLTSNLSIKFEPGVVNMSGAQVGRIVWTEYISDQVTSMMRYTAMGSGTYTQSGRGTVQ